MRRESARCRRRRCQCAAAGRPRMPSAVPTAAGPLLGHAPELGARGSACMREHWRPDGAAALQGPLPLGQRTWAASGHASTHGVQVRGRLCLKDPTEAQYKDEVLRVRELCIRRFQPPDRGHRIADTGRAGGACLQPPPHRPALPTAALPSNRWAPPACSSSTPIAGQQAGRRPGASSPPAAAGTRHSGPSSPPGERPAAWTWGLQGCWCRAGRREPRPPAGGSGAAAARRRAHCPPLSPPLWPVLLPLHHRSAGSHVGPQRQERAAGGQRRRLLQRRRRRVVPARHGRRGRGCAAAACLSARARSAAAAGARLHAIQSPCCCR